MEFQEKWMWRWAPSNINWKKNIRCGKTCSWKFAFCFCFFRTHENSALSHSCSLHSHFHFSLTRLDIWRKLFDDVTIGVRKRLPNVSFFYGKELGVDIVVIKIAKKLSILVVPWNFVFVICRKCHGRHKSKQGFVLQFRQCILRISLEKFTFNQHHSWMNRHLPENCKSEREFSLISLSIFSLPSLFYFIYKQKSSKIRKKNMICWE